MNEREKLTELLKDYRSYRFAARNAESYDGPDWGSVRIASGKGDLFVGLNEWDRRRNTRIVSLIDEAVEDVLDDEMQTVIRYKYLERNSLTLQQIADSKLKCHERRAKYLHKKALDKMGKALIFLHIPEKEIENLDFHLQKTGA